VTTTVHVYTFARADDTTNRSVVDVAIDLVADNLLPTGGATIQQVNRKEELNSLGCQVTVKEVRDVAPGKAVLCVSFRATRVLIKHMQGDFL